MISGIGNQNYAVEQFQNKPVAQVDKPYTEIPPDTTNNLDTRANALSFVKTATPEEMKEKVDSLIGRQANLAPINFNELRQSPNQDEILGRIKRLNEKIEQESASVLQKEQELISQGRSAGKSDKEILFDIIAMEDNQSDLYKMSMRWGNSGLTAPENLSKLRELTPNYVNVYA
jgi:hypothetical protein